MPASPYKFEIGAFIMMQMSGERGEVRGRAEYLDTENNYYIRYLTGQGCQVETWVGESAICLQDAVAV